MNGSVGTLYRIDRGDGDPDFFNQEILARRVIENWFSGKLPRGEAYLLKVESGKFEGNYIAITSKLKASLSEQLSTSKWISVVVHRIKTPGPRFVASIESADAVGMAVIEALG